METEKVVILIAIFVILSAFIGGGVLFISNSNNNNNTDTTTPTQVNNTQVNNTQINNTQLNENTRTDDEEENEDPNENEEVSLRIINHLKMPFEVSTKNNKNSNKLSLSNKFKGLSMTGTNIENFDNYKENQKMPTTGSEPTYDESQWNDPDFVKTNNCYAYFLDDKKDREQKPQPGYFSGNKSPNNYNGCIETERRVLADNPDIYIVEETQRCKNGYYKGFLAIDTGKDYHFYRQDSSGFWSHKPGALQITNLDSNGEIITNPRKASRNYSNFQYTTSCNYFCVPKNEYKKTNAK